MIIATFGPTTAWAGKTITREGDVFTLEGHGPITAADVMEYDRPGHLVWADAGTRAWVGSKAGAAASLLSAAASDPASVGAVLSAPASTSVKNRAASARPTVSRWLVVAVVAGLAILAVVAALAVSGVFGSQGNVATLQIDSWPGAFEGTWVSDADHFEKLIVSRTPEQVVLTRTAADGNAITFTFKGDTLTWDSEDGSAPSVFTRTAGSPGDFVGNYDWVMPAGTMRIVMSYDGRALTMITRSTLESDALRSTYTLADDGRSVVLNSSSSDRSATFTRQ